MTLKFDKNEIFRTSQQILNDWSKLKLEIDTSLYYLNAFFILSFVFKLFN